MTKKLIYSMPEALSLGDDATLQAIDDYTSGLSAGVRLGGIKELADVLPPGKPGNLVGIIGVSGSFKSTMTAIMAVSRAEQLVRDAHHNKVVVCVSFEESVETMAQRIMAKHLGINLSDLVMGKIQRQLFDDIKSKAYAKVSGLSIYIIAPKDSAPDNGDIINYTMRDNTRASTSCEGIVSAMEMLYNERGLMVDSIYIDYLQNMVSLHSENNRLYEKQKIDYHIDWCVNLAKSFRTTVVLCSQASTKEYDHLDKVPLGRDASKGSTVFGERCDIVYTLGNMMKSHYISDIGDDEVIEGIPGLYQLEFQEKLFLLTVAKSKKTEEGITVPLLINPATMQWQISQQWFNTKWARRYGHKWDAQVHAIWR